MVYVDAIITAVEELNETKRIMLSFTHWAAVGPVYLSNRLGSPPPGPLFVNFRHLSFYKNVTKRYLEGTKIQEIYGNLFVLLQISIFRKEGRKTGRYEGTKENRK